MEGKKTIKTSLGMDENVEGLLCYLLTWITGIVFLILERQSKFVKFHAIQSLVTFLALFLIILIFGGIPFVGWLISFVAGVLGFILWIVLMYKAYKGEMFKLPVVGDFAERQISK